jgi:polyisoprenoid-binding protein YceI
MILDFDFDSVAHCLLPQRFGLSGPKCIRQARIFACVASLTFLFAFSPTDASEYPGTGSYDIDKDASELRVLIHPAGILKGMGHSHVISTSNIAGRIVIADDPVRSSVELTIPVESFEIDIEALRLEEGEAFEEPVPDKAKRGTRKNMLGEKQLDSRNFSMVIVKSSKWSGELPDILVSGEFTVRDQTNILEFPASVAVADDQIVVTGSFSVTHEELGLKPFRAGLGTIRVRDEMEMKFRITARRVPDRG